MAVVGFDLDMTLVDSSRAIVETAKRALAEFEVSIETQILGNSIGLPLVNTFKEQLGSEVLAIAIYERYKKLYLLDGFRLTKPNPGAKELLTWLKMQGHSTVVITAKNEFLARKQLSFCELDVDFIYGDSFASGKSSAMIASGCQIYVGDHEEDYFSARQAKVNFVGITTNSNSKILTLSESHSFKCISSLAQIAQIVSMQFKS